MAYRVTIPIALGASNTGLTLSAQLVDTSGANVGSAVTTGFVEIGSGYYLWDYSSVPDGHRGGVKISAGATLKTFTTISPYDAENLDAKITSRAAPGDAMTLTSGERDAVATALLDLANGVETGYTVRKTLRIIASALVGKTNGAGTTNITFRAIDDSKVRITATVTTAGERSSVTLDGT